MSTLEHGPVAPEGDELVTTALLGTDRRPALTATELLGEAARRWVRTRSSPTLAHCPAAATAPEPERPWAPPAAQDLLDALLARPVAELVNAWLAAAVEAHVLLPPQHWTPLAGLAATRPDYDRRLLAGALGAAGCWFLEQNPAWQRLAVAVRAPAPVPARRDPTGGAGALPGEAELRARPDAALDVPGPWPRSLAVAALRVLLSGQLGWRAAAYGSALGTRMHPGDADLLAQAHEALADDGRASAPGVRLVQDALVAAARSVEIRAEIARTFATGPVDPPPSRKDPDGPE
ncbi:hypothetical protein [uncultured Friedmanniella sp.]|uniref:DUF5691 domain-containing protein n=1 Tax=uncultured Friedmanniella sp. TaxID=335381 RepID=UPI0035CC09FE